MLGKEQIEACHCPYNGQRGDSTEATQRHDFLPSYLGEASLGRAILAITGHDGRGVGQHDLKIRHQSQRHSWMNKPSCKQQASSKPSLGCTALRVSPGSCSFMTLTADFTTPCAHVAGPEQGRAAKPARPRTRKKKCKPPW